MLTDVRQKRMGIDYFLPVETLIYRCRLKGKGTAIEQMLACHMPCSAE
jgi:hypothetical protein